MTHAELVQHAAVWLKQDHGIVITEIATIGEEPDALGFASDHSTLVESKATRADFISDRKKWFRRSPYMGIGNYRYYMAPKGLIEVSELPPSWGLIEVREDGRRRMKKRAEHQEKNAGQEQRILVSAIRRLGPKLGEECQAIGVSVKLYTHETQNRATLSIAHHADEAVSP